MKIQSTRPLRDFNASSLPVGACCAHDALFLPNGSKKLAMSFFVNLVFALLVFVSGMLFGSSSLFAKFLHNLSDVLSIGLAWFLESYSRKESNDKYTYGYRRFSVLGALFIAIILIYTSLSILGGNIVSFLYPELDFGAHDHGAHSHGITQAQGMLYIAIIGFLAKGCMALFLWRSKSLNERAVMLHMLLDALSWFVILVSAIVMIFFDLPWLDLLLSTLLALQILDFAIRILLKSVRILAQGSPQTINVKSLRQVVSEIVGVVTIEDLRLWSIDGVQNVLTMRIHYDVSICPEADAVEALIEEIRFRIAELGIEQSTIEAVASHKGA